MGLERIVGVVGTSIVEFAIIEIELEDSEVDKRTNVQIAMIFQNLIFNKLFENFIPIFAKKILVL